MRSAGIHHITAIAGDPQTNLDFYTETLGLRLVKRTVNYDDPGSYHFYFGDNVGSPGTIITFFPWPGARRGSIMACACGDDDWYWCSDCIAGMVERVKSTNGGRPVLIFNRIRPLSPVISSG